MRLLAIVLVGILLLVATVAPALSDGHIKSEAVSFKMDGVKYTGYLAYDSKISGTRPGVLVVHEWWGHNDYARKRAMMLADMGYTALALDMYGDGKQADHPKDAKKFMMEVFSNLESAKLRFEASKKILENHPTTDPDRTAAIGYCFGGAVVLHMARSGMNLKGVASFHGNLGTRTPARPGDIQSSMLVAHGAEDRLIPAEQVKAFKQEMAAAGVDLKFIAYPGAKHSFTNPGSTAIGKKYNLPLAYNEEADRDSWQELDSFLKRIF